MWGFTAVNNTFLFAGVLLGFAVVLGGVLITLIF